MNTVKIPDKLLIRDTHSKALLSTDRDGLNEYLAKRELAKKQIQEQKEVREKIQKIEQDMSDIKHLLQEIISLRNKHDN